MTPARNSKKCDFKNPCQSLRKLVGLLEHPIAEQHIERQMEIFDDLICTTIYAFWLRDIPFYIRLFEAITKTTSRILLFKKPLQALLHFACTPPMMIKSSDMINFARDFQQYFSMLGYLIIHLEDRDLSLLVTDVILSLLQRRNRVRDCCVPLRFCLEAARASRLPEICGQLLEVIDESLYPKLLRVIILLIRDSQSTCIVIAKEKAIDFLLRRLQHSWLQSASTQEENDENSNDKESAHEQEAHQSNKKQTNQQCQQDEQNSQFEQDEEDENDDKNDQANIMNYEESCQILWFLLKAIDGIADDIEVPSLAALRSLCWALKALIFNSTNAANRNNLMALTLKLIRVFKNMELIESGLADEIACLSVATERCTECCCNVFNKFSASYDDYQFKKFLLACLPYFDQHNAGKIIEDNKVVIGLIDIIEYKKDKWNDEEYCELAMIVLRILPRVVPHAFRDFLIVDGPSLIIKTIRSYIEHTYESNLLLNALHCLYEILLLKDNSIVEYVLVHGGHSAVLDVSHQILEFPVLRKTLQMCLGRCFCILQILSVTTNLNTSEIDLCVNYMKRLLNQKERDPPAFRGVVICGMTYLWQAVVKNPKHLDGFIRIGGIYHMLDIMSSCSYPVKLVTLGGLADICAKGLGIPHLITWRNNGQRLVPMLMEIFRGDTQVQCALKSNEAEYPIPDHDAVLSLCDNLSTGRKICRPDFKVACRPKIHGILEMLVIKYKDVVEVANEHYGLFRNDELNTDDKITLLFAENYLSLELCQAWLDLDKDLKKDEFEPTPEDNSKLCDLVDRIRKWKAYMLTKAAEYIDDELAEDEMQEVYTYNDLKTGRLSEALECLRDLSYISKCTEHMYRIIRRMTQLERQESCLRFKKGATLHRTAMDGLTITNLFDQNMDIQSNIIEKRGKRDSLVLPVSPIDSETIISIRESDDLLTEDQLKLGNSCNI